MSYRYIRSNINCKQLRLSCKRKKNKGKAFAIWREKQKELAEQREVINVLKDVVQKVSIAAKNIGLDEQTSSDVNDFMNVSTVDINTSEVAPTSAVVKTPSSSSLQIPAVDPYTLFETFGGYPYSLPISSNSIQISSNGKIVCNKSTSTLPEVSTPVRNTLTTKKKFRTHCNAATQTDFDDIKSSKRKRLKPVPKEVVIYGRRIIDFEYFFKVLKSASTHGKYGCSLNDIIITGEGKTGICTSYNLRCTKCNFEKEIWSENVSKKKNLNVDFVSGMLSINCSFQAMNVLFVTMKLPMVSHAEYIIECDKISLEKANKTSKQSEQSEEKETSIHTAENCNSSMSDKSRDFQDIDFGSLLIEDQFEIKEENYVFENEKETIIPDQAPSVDKLVNDQVMLSAPVIKQEIDSDVDNDESISPGTDRKDTRNEKALVENEQQSNAISSQQETRSCNNGMIFNQEQINLHKTTMIQNIQINDKKITNKKSMTNLDNRPDAEFLHKKTTIVAPVGRVGVHKTYSKLERIEAEHKLHSDGYKERLKLVNVETTKIKENFVSHCAAKSKNITPTGQVVVNKTYSKLQRNEAKHKLYSDGDKEQLKLVNVGTTKIRKDFVSHSVAKSKNVTATSQVDVNKTYNKLERNEAEHKLYSDGDKEQLKLVNINTTKIKKNLSHSAVNSKNVTATGQQASVDLGENTPCEAGLTNSADTKDIQITAQGDNRVAFVPSTSTTFQQNIPTPYAGVSPLATWVNNYTGSNSFIRYPGANGAAFMPSTSTVSQQNIAMPNAGIFPLTSLVNNYNTGYNPLVKQPGGVACMPGAIQQPPCLSIVTPNTSAAPYILIPSNAVPLSANSSYNTPPLVADRSRWVGRANMDSNNPFFTLPGGTPKGVSDPVPPKRDTEQSKHQSKRPKFHCDYCDINFPKYESYDSHKKIYCIKRIKVPPSSTVTSHILNNNNSIPPTSLNYINHNIPSIEQLLSAMTIKRSFLECSVKIALDAQYIINLHKSAQDLTRETFNELHDVLKREKALTPESSIEEQQIVSQAKAQAVIKAEAAYKQEKYSASAVEQALYKQKKAIEASLTATKHEQTSLISTLMHLKMQSGKIGNSCKVADKIPSNLIPVPKISTTSDFYIGQKNELVTGSTSQVNVLENVSYHDFHSKDKEFNVVNFKEREAMTSDIKLDDSLHPKEIDGITSYSNPSASTLQNFLKVESNTGTLNVLYNDFPETQKNNAETSYVNSDVTLQNYQIRLPHDSLHLQQELYVNVSSPTECRLNSIPESEKSRPYDFSYKKLRDLNMGPFSTIADTSVHQTNESFTQSILSGEIMDTSVTCTRKKHNSSTKDTS